MDKESGDAELNIRAESVSDTLFKITLRLGDQPVFVDKIDVSKHKSRDAFCSKACEGRPGINSREIYEYLVKLAAQEGDGNDKPKACGPSREELLEGMTPLAREQARHLLETPQLLKAILDDIGSLGVAGEKELAATIYLVGTSRLLSAPLACILQGPSASGKSYTIEKVAALFPAEAVVLATQMTPQALFYMPPGSLMHRFVVAGERSRVEDDETAEATRALREMLASGKLTKLVPVKAEGQILTQVIEQDGPIAFVESTTLGSIFDEDLNRCILLTTDERQAQTKKIIDSIAARYASNGAASLKQLIDRHHALQRMIEPLRVIVPFAPLLAEHFTCERVEARRAFPHVLSLIQASALLHQFQRQRDDHGYVLADPSDYHLTRHLLAGPLARQLGGGLSDPAKRFFDRLAPKVGNGTFSTKDARQHVHGSRASVYGWLSELAEAGVMQMVEAQRGPRPASWQIVGPIEGAVPKLLPATEELFPDFGKTLGH